MFAHYKNDIYLVFPFCSCHAPINLFCLHHSGFQCLAESSSSNIRLFKYLKVCNICSFVIGMQTRPAVSVYTLNYLIVSAVQKTVYQQNRTSYIVCPEGVFVCCLYS